MSESPAMSTSGSYSELPSLATADAVAAELVRIYGTEPRSTGVVHVTAVWQRSDGQLVTLRTGGDAPRVAHDALALGLARARADAILTTAEVLRREPELRHELPGPGALPEGMAAWRRRLGKTSKPLLCVMTRSGDVDLAHPAFRQAGRSVIYASREAAWALESRVSDAGVELVAADEPTTRDAVGLLRREFGAATVTVEAGPSVARDLYREADDEGDAAKDHRDWTLEPPTQVDELLLTVLHAPDLETRFRGPSFMPRADVEALLGRPASTRRLKSVDGEWELARYVRR